MSKKETTTRRVGKTEEQRWLDAIAAWKAKS